jgi:hypothetical protein
MTQSNSIRSTRHQSYSFQLNPATEYAQDSIGVIFNPSSILLNPETERLNLSTFCMILNPRSIHLNPASECNPTQSVQSGHNPEGYPAIEFEASIGPQSLIDVNKVGSSNWERSNLSTQSWQSGIIL